MRPFLQMLYLNLPQMNVVDRRYLIQCLSLMTLTKPWVKKSVNLSRTITYHRLLHANMHHKDGKTHAYTVHVKICRPRNDLRQKHRDSHFAMVSVKFARELANLFGTIMCFSCTKMYKFYHFGTRKTCVYLGLPIFKKQTIILMHLEYKVMLPDHDFLTIRKHKLIPSVSLPV